MSVALATALKSPEHDASLDCCILEWADASFGCSHSFYMLNSLGEEASELNH